MASSYALCHICYLLDFLRHFSLCRWKLNEIQILYNTKDEYMYTYMSICIYIKQKNTVCHIWFMCNTFSGCLKLVISSTLLCWGIARVRCYWSCLPWIVAWSWRKDNVTSTFLTYCNVSSLSLSITGRTNSHTLTQVTLFTARQLYQWSLPQRTSAGVTDGLSTPRSLGSFNPPPPCILTHRCH